jgi:hypothetical protein
MCAILDTAVVHEVFSRCRPDAGEGFRRWIDSGRGQLVIGGRLREELVRYNAFRPWLVEALRAGRATSLNDAEVEKRETRLRQSGVCESNDQHIIALAQLSNARLLYTNDDALSRDFGKKELIDNPRGKVYSTKSGGEFNKRRRQLLQRGNLCNPR